MTGLQSEVSMLSQQLREALDKQANLFQALQETREAMELYQTTARQVGWALRDYCIFTSCIPGSGAS